MSTLNPYTIAVEIFLFYNAQSSTQAATSMHYSYNLYDHINLVFDDC